MHENRALQESGEQFRILFESNPLPMWVYDSETLGFLAVNLAAVSHYGYSTQEFLDMNITDIRPPEDVPALLEDVNQRRLRLDQSGPWRHVTKDGRIREVEIKSHTLEFKDRPAVLVVVDDVTDRREADRQREHLENQLRTAQKMEAVGKLAGGIAHDFNNLLSVIMNYAKFLKEDLDERDPRRDDLEEITKAAERGAKLVRQVLTFSRKEITNPEVLSLNRIVSEMERMLRRTLGEDIDLEFDLSDDLWATRVDPGKVEQVLVNLILNSRDAMKHGGKLIITTHNSPLPDGLDGHPEMPGNDYVSMSVTDTGEGMTEEIRARIFEPFFSTRPLGEGTGLGLAMVYGIVKQANGFIYTDSKSGTGATFHIYLPAAHEEPVAPAADRPRAQTGGGTETVLLVEDERAVRELANRILERAGYKVICAASGTEAIDAYMSVRGRVDLVLTDVIMPGMSGKEINARLRELGNGFKTLYMSGYTDEILAERGQMRAEEELIQKPFSADSLLEKVREVLDG